MATTTASTHDNTRLTSVEMASLWNGYMLESLVHPIFHYFLHHIEDEDIKSLVEFCHSISKEHLDDYIAVFKKQNFPIPRGITAEDVNLDAPRLFTDVYYISYIRTMSKYALTMYGNSFVEVTRDDMEHLFSKFLDNIRKVELKAHDIMLAKGLYNRPPYVPMPKQVDFVEKQNFMTGFFGDKRPLTVNEISILFSNAEANALGKAMVMGFSQVTQNKEVRQFLLRGKEIAHKYLHVFNDILTEEDISPVPSYDGDVTESTVAPFSDRLMMFHDNLMVSRGLMNYGMGMALSQRRDLGTLYARILAEVAAYAEDGANLLIEKGWMEQPPLAADRNDLAQKRG